MRGLLANRFPADRVLFQAHSISGPQRPGDALFATGHVGYDYIARFENAPAVFTVLREPTARSMSALVFFQSHSEAFLQTLATELSAAEFRDRRLFQQRARELGAEHFLIEEEALARRWLANVQTRQLAGAEFVDCRDDDPRLLDAALDHLGRIDLAGLLEREQESLQLLAQIMRWEPLGPLQHLNQTPQTRDLVITERSRDIMRSWNLLDDRLYAEACRLFAQKQASLANRGGSSPLRATDLRDGRFTPDQPLQGQGWHEREFFQQRFLCWSSAEMATLTLRTSTAHPSRFRCMLSHVFNAQALERLTIRLNGTALSLRRRGTQEGILIESENPAACWTTDPHRASLTFHCPVMGGPHDLDPQSRDIRRLGFALAWLELK